MGPNLIIHSEAQQEFTSAYLWYEEKQIGLGEKFIQQIENVYAFIIENPIAFAKKKNNTREALVNKFPFIIIYRYYRLENKIVVLAVFHTSRNPATKRSK